MLIRNRFARLERSALIPTPMVPTPTVRLRTPADVLGVVEEQVNRLRADPRSSAVEKARAMGTLARVTLGPISAHQMTARIEAREAVLARMCGALLVVSIGVDKMTPKTLGEPCAAMEATPISLLEQMRSPAPGPAWDRFVHLYTPLLYLWANRLGINGPDADDVVQDVFTILVEKLPAFRHNPDQRFRGWLWTILANKVRQRSRRASFEQLNDEPLTSTTVPDPADETAEQEYRDILVRRALELMKNEFEVATWTAFLESVTTDQSATEVATRLGVTPDAVYQAKSRVLRRLRKELEGLLD